MGNIWDKMFNKIFQNEAIVGCKFDVRKSCRARHDLSFILILFLHLLSKFIEKLRIINFTLENLFDVTLISTLKGKVSI